MAPLYFIFAQKFFDNRDNRPQSTCVGLDKLGFFLIFDIFVLLKVMKTLGTQCPIAIYPANLKKLLHATHSYVYEVVGVLGTKRRVY